MKFFREVTDEMKYFTALYIDADISCREVAYYTIGSFFNKIIILDDISHTMNVFIKNNIDIIFLDADIDSTNILKEIRKINKNVLVITISKNKNPKYFMELEQYNLNGSLVKPFNIKNFLMLFKEIIHKRRNDLLQQYSLVTDLNLAIFKTDGEGIITYVNEIFCRLCGYEEIELINKEYNILRYHDDLFESFKVLLQTVKNKDETCQFTLKNVKKDQSAYYSKITISPLYDKYGKINEYICLNDNITELINPRKQLLDFSESMNDFIYVLIKIEDYDILTALWGENIMDKLQKQVYKLITDKLKKDNRYFKIFSLENGEYGLIKENNELKRNILELIIYLKTFQNSINSLKISFDNLEFSVSLLLSIATEKSALKDATLGLSKLKEDKTNFIVANNLSYDEKIKAKQNIKILEITKQAIEENKILCFFQPIIDNKSKKIIKYESLVRLVDNYNNILAPHSFLSIVKQSKYYSQITSAVLKSSFKALDCTDCDISINLSMLDIENEESCEEIITLLKNNSSRTHRITFELLESESSKDFSKIKTFIKTLKYLGVKIAIDDFGCGYSNFERIMQYQPDIIKIDGSLVKNIVHDKFSHDLVETIASFAKKQNIKTVAEYVENEAIYDILSQLEIDYSQGYFFGKPENLFY